LLPAQTRLFWRDGKFVKGNGKRKLGLELKIVRASSSFNDMVTPMARN
jgi:hypothetical protein